MSTDYNLRFRTISESSAVSERHRSVSECDPLTGSSPTPATYLQMVDSLLASSPGSTVCTTPHTGGRRFSTSDSTAWHRPQPIQAPQPLPPLEFNPVSPRLTKSDVLKVAMPMQSNQGSAMFASFAPQMMDGGEAPVQQEHLRPAAAPVQSTGLENDGFRVAVAPFQQTPHVQARVEQLRATDFVPTTPPFTPSVMIPAIPLCAAGLYLQQPFVQQQQSGPTQAGASHSAVFFSHMQPPESPMSSRTVNSDETLVQTPRNNAPHPVFNWASRMQHLNISESYFKPPMSPITVQSLTPTEIYTQKFTNLEPPVSHMLLLFRENRLVNPPLQSLRGHIVAFSQDQYGSRYIQQQIETAGDADRALVFNEVYANADLLINDVFGNYVVQRCIEYGTLVQRALLMAKLRGRVLRLSLQMYGCRVVQKALEFADDPTKESMLSELKNHVWKCVHDQNANHVMQKAIEATRANPKQFAFIVDGLAKHGPQGIVDLAVHTYGCRVLQRVLEFGSAEQKETVLRVLKPHLERLVSHEYGNYVVQNVLEHGRSDDREVITAYLLENVVSLSQHKYASNVVERVLTSEFVPSSIRAALIDELIRLQETYAGNSEPPLVVMAKDKYANYVVQKMFDAADHEQRRRFLVAIRPHVQLLKKFPFSKYIVAKLDKFLTRKAQAPADLAPRPRAERTGSSFRTAV